ncbi:hypothetical protein ACWCSH_24270 [Streptosporangium sp. NPDC001682]
MDAVTCSWAEHLPGQARADAPALMALGFGCGLTSGEPADSNAQDM